MASFMFLRPYYAWLFLPVMFLLIGLYLKRDTYNPWKAHIDPALLKFFFPESMQINSKKSTGILALIWGLTCFALMGPSFKQNVTPITQARIPRIILLDLSQNMLAEDLTPNRLTRAKFKLHDLIQYKSSSSTNSDISLVVFSEEAFLVSPFTNDQQTLLNFLNRLSPDLMPVSGHNLSKAFTFCDNLFKKNHITSGQIILVTASDPTQRDLKTARALQTRGIQLAILGVGTQAQLPEAMYHQLARANQGLYQSISNDEKDLHTILSAYTTERFMKKSTTFHAEDNGYYFVWILAILTLLGFRQGLFERLISL